MTGINGSLVRGLLDDRHGPNCSGQEYSTCRPAPYGNGFVVVYMEWCGDCGAVDWEYVDKMLPEGDA